MAYDPYNPPTMSMGRRRTLASTLGTAPASNPQAGLGPLSRQLLAGGHPITSAQTPEAQYGVPKRTYGGRGAAGTLAPAAQPQGASLASDVFSREAPGPTAMGTPRRQISTLGSLFGGATPGQVAYGGGTRQGFLDQPAPESGVNIKGPRPLVPSGISPGLSQNGNDTRPMNDKEVSLAGVIGMGPRQYAMSKARNTPQQLAANKLAYDSRLKAAALNPPQTAYQKRQAMRQAQDQTLFDRLFAQQNPGAAAQMAGVKAAGQRQADLLAHNAAEGKAKREVDAQRNNLAAVVGLVQGGVPVDEAQRMIAAKGGNASIADAFKDPTKAPDAATLKGLSPDERAQALKGFSPATQERLGNEVNQKGYLHRLFFGIDQPGQTPISAQGTTVNHYNPLWRLFHAGINTPTLNPAIIKDRPGDTPEQKKAKDALRASRRR